MCSSLTFRFLLCLSFASFGALLAFGSGACLWFVASLTVFHSVSFFFVLLCLFSLPSDCLLSSISRLACEFLFRYFLRGSCSFLLVASRQVPASLPSVLLSLSLCLLSALSLSLLTSLLLSSLLSSFPLPPPKMSQRKTN